MVTEGEQAQPSSTGATAALSQNRPIVMPESFAALESEEWDSWIAHFEDCAVINGWSAERKAQFLAVRMRGAALLRLQNIPADVRGNYDNLKAALREKFVPQERVELHKAEFRARRREKDEKLPDLSGSIRRLVRRAYPAAGDELQDSLARDQFIDALEDRDMRMKIRESGPKTLDEAVSRALELEAMFEAESRRSKSRSVRVVQEPPQDRKDELVEILRQNKAAMEQMVAVVQQQQQQSSNASTGRASGRQPNGRGLGPSARRDLRLRLCFKCHKKGHFMADCKTPQTGSGNKS